MSPNATIFSLYKPFLASKLLPFLKHRQAINWRVKRALGGGGGGGGGGGLN